MSARETNEQRIKAIISRVAGFPLEEINEEIRIRDDLLVDSLKQMEIVARIEHTFDIPLEESKLVCLETLGEFFDLIHAEIEAASA